MTTQYEAEMLSLLDPRSDGGAAAPAEAPDIPPVNGSPDRSYEDLATAEVDVADDSGVSD